jgi:hypothetical protein
MSSHPLRSPVAETMAWSLVVSSQWDQGKLREEYGTIDIGNFPWADQLEL